jgi:membrane protease YdiL (CAAX protease family)
MLPMFTFLGFVWLGGTFSDWYPTTYVLRVVIVAALLIYFWPQFTRIRWDYWWLGLIVGVIGIFQWVGMQQFLQEWQFTARFFRPTVEVDPVRHYTLLLQQWAITPSWFEFRSTAFSPIERFGAGTWQFYTFVAIRWICGAVIVVPIMEELFWRDFVWRSIAAPADFKLAQIGEHDWKAFFGTAVVFAVVHGNWWLTSIVWALMISALLWRTRSIGACIIAHATTNFLLGAYVLYTRDWTYW